MSRSVVGQARRRAGVLAELAGFLWARKLWWMVPLFALLLLLALLIALAQTSAVAPWMYPLVTA